MRRLAVVAQALAVVADDDDDRSIEKASLFQRPDEHAYLLIHEGHRGVIRKRVSAEVPCGRRARGMSVVEVEPREEARAVDAVDPVRRTCHDLVGASTGAQSAELVTYGLDVVHRANPCARPREWSSTLEATKAPVWNPDRAFIDEANVMSPVRSGSTLVFSRTP